jgi:hypothetical protein
MEDSAHQRISDRGLWLSAISLLVALSGYMALAANPWGLAMGSALVVTALLLNYKRLADSGAQKAMFTSLLLAVAAGLALALLHLVVGPAIRG